MPNPEDSAPSGPVRDAQFAATSWTLVMAARQAGSPEAGAALEKLCESYWYPLYAYVRRKGNDPDKAQDLTQEFFYRLIRENYLGAVDRRRGKFRSFLLTFLKHFLSDQRDRAKAQKRGGGRALISLEEMAAEERGWAEPQDGATPEHLFERRWAHALLEQAVRRLRAEYVDNHKGELFDVLKDIQPGERGELSYAEIGARFGLTEQAVKNAVHRLRRRHREILRDEIAQTLNDASEIEGEIQHLMAVIAR